MLARPPDPTLRQCPPSTWDDTAEARRLVETEGRGTEPHARPAHELETESEHNIAQHIDL